MMMDESKNKRSPFYVVRFLKSPYPGIDDYVCVPNTWMVFCKAPHQPVVAYPKNENPTETRDRAKRMARYEDEWWFYSVEIKYETNTYEDAEYWITTRNNNGPLVPENSSIHGAQPTPPGDRELCSSTRNDSSKSKEDKLELTVKPYEIPQKPLPKVMNKRSASVEPKQLLEPKRPKLMTISAARAVCGLIPNANPQPGSSRTEQSTTRNDQLMETAQTKETSAVTNSEESNEQSTKSIDQKVFKRSRQEPSMPIINEYGPTEVNIEGQDQSQRDKQPSKTKNNIQNHLTSNMTSASMTAPLPPAIVEQNPQPHQHNHQKHPQDSGNFQPQITDVRSLATTSKNQKSRSDDISNNGPSTSQHIPDTISARLYDIIKGKPSLVPLHPPIEKKMRLENITRNVALPNRSTLMDENELFSGPPAREPPVTRIQNRLPVDSQEIPHVARINIERPHNVTAVDPRVVLQSINNVASAARNPSSTPQQRPSYIRILNEQQNLPAPQQHMQQATRGQDLAQRPSGSPSVDQSANATQHQPNRPGSPPIRIRIPSFNRYPGGRRNRFIGGLELPYRAQLELIQQESRRPPRDPRPAGVFPIPTVERPSPSRRGIRRRSPSPVLSVVPESISKALFTTQNNYLSNEQQLQILTNEISAVSRNYPQNMDLASQADQSMEGEPRSPFYGIASDSEDDADYGRISDHEMSTDEEPIETTNNINLTEHNTADRPMTAQNFSSRGALEQQMLDQFATIFTQMASTLMGNIEKFNAMASSASHASSSRNVRQEVPPVAEERPAAAVERGNRDNGNQPSNNAVNEPPERNHNNRWRFVLPPAYDSEDTKWTLKYREHMDGLVELLPRSGIYVSHATLRRSKEESNNCQSLAQRLLVEVFKRSALSVCSSITEKAQIGYKMRPDARPDLDDHGCLVLLNFVLEYGLKRGWNTDMLSILQGLHNKVKELRYNGVFSMC